MTAVYPLIVAAHVASVVFLVGGMMMHERLVAMIAHLPSDKQATTLDALLRLDRQLVSPALLLTWTFGLTLALWHSWFSSPWLMIKLVIVVALSALHGIQSGRLRRAVRDGSSVKSIKGSAFGIVSGLLVIAALAIAKPF